MNKLRSELPSHLLYHNADHTVNVVNACSYLAEKEGLASDDKELLLVAAHFHDAGFLVRYQNNEHTGARIAAETLPKFGYDEDEIRVIKELIISTDTGIAPQGLMQEIIHDADLNYLGRPDYKKRSDDLRKEMARMGQEFSDRDWLELQYQFLKEFSYCTNAAKQLVQSGFEKNKRRIEETIKALDPL